MREKRDFFCEELFGERKFFITLLRLLNLKTLNNMKELVAKIQAEYANFAVNAEAQVTKNNKAAGTRARKAALELSKLMKEFRKVSVEAAK